MNNYKRIAYTIIIWLLGLQEIYTANILIALPYSGKSHYNFFRPIFLELANRRHQLTLITNYVEENLPSNVKQLKIETGPVYTVFQNDVKMPVLDFFQQKCFIQIQMALTHFLAIMTEMALNSTSVKDFLLNDRSVFDLVIVEDFGFDAFYMLAHKYNTPLVTFATSSSVMNIQRLMGNSWNFNYVSHEFFLETSPFNYWQKMKNIYYTLSDMLIKVYYHYSIHNNLVAKYFDNLPKPFPRVQDLAKNVSLVLMNSHFSIETVKPVPPNIVDIGGVHLQSTQALSQNLQKILDEAVDGLILFSLGSILKSEDFSKEKIDAFINVFTNLKQTIIWKWEGETISRQPKNLFISKWLPQNDILAHPNVCLFITHGGLLSLQEAIYHGVPIIGIPVYTDQPLNIEKAIKLGFGEKLDYKFINAENINKTIQKVLNDKTYAEKAKEISILFKDRPQSALETAVYWIEYVIRHKGASHLKLPSASMSFCEYHMLDLFLILMIAIYSIYCIIKLLLLTLLKLVTVQNKSTKRKKS